jgi:RNA polymerase sigma-70 factor, ECF subfamily
VWIEPYADQRLGVEDGYAAPEPRFEQREGVELAFIAALQHLPASQRAVLILRDVLGFSARETADVLGRTVASVNGALRRARKAAAERLPDRTQQVTLRELGDERIRELAQRYIEAWEHGDVDAILALLAEDAAFAMPPLPTTADGTRLPPSSLATRSRIGGDCSLRAPTASSRLAVMPGTPTRRATPRFRSTCSPWMGRVRAR